LKEEREGMIGYRCPNNLFLYCREPAKMLKPPIAPEAPGGGIFGAPGICRLDPNTCGGAQTLGEQVKEMTERRNKGRG